MTLRMEWRETLDWLHMEYTLVYFKEPLKLPEAEFDSFMTSWLARMGSFARTTSHSPTANNPTAKFLWWCWLWLDEEQKETIRSFDDKGVIAYMTREFECFPALIAEMRNPRNIGLFWSVENYVTNIHKLTPKCIVRLDRVEHLDVFFKYVRDPKCARINNLAIQYHENVDDILAYVGPTYSVISHDHNRLILKTPNGNAQILKDQWLWFNGLELCHGDLKRLKQVQMSYLDPREAPGFWIKPKPTKQPIPQNNLCPEVA